MNKIISPVEAKVLKEIYHMTEHEKLKAICDEIGYTPKEHYSKGFGYVKLYGPHPTMDDPLPCNDVIEIDAREIIFTPSFIQEFWKYKSEWGFSKRFFHNALMEELEDPVDYLYNLLEL